MVKKYSLGGTSHVDSGSGSVGSFCNGEIYSDPTTIKLHSISMLLSLKPTTMQFEANFLSTKIIK